MGKAEVVMMGEDIVERGEVHSKRKPVFEVGAETLHYLPQ